TGTTPKTTNTENFGDFIPFLGPGDIANDGNIIYGNNKGLSELGLKEARLVQPNSILVTCIGSIGKSGIVDRICACNQQINIVFANFANYKLVYYFIISSYFQELMQTKSTGTVMPIINKGIFEQIYIPLPPLKEQEKIVKILDELFTLKKALRVE
ncbi:restriction endonuclease subunit S, partial [Campylobacter sp. LR196d]|uniref:restriction endonuclease subunit S n=1 Tax=Campylobacter sp. LR196d TaxID=2593543 RepID=UPI001285B2C5